jgi:apolipoprotein N-acyltransferase
MPVLPVVQFAAIAGTYGLGLLTVVVAAMPAVLSRPSRAHRMAMLVCLLVLAAVAGWGGLRLADGSTAAVEGVRLRLVQANIEQTLKWNPEMRMQHFQEHLTLTTQPGWDRVTDVIWPETAAPTFLERDNVARGLMAAATPPGGLLISGAVRGTAPNVEPFRIWNSLLALDGRGDIVGTYDKAHLVPFGEYVPLHGLLPLDKITAGSVDFTPGTGVATLALPGLPPVGPLICYEVIFPGEVVDRAHRPQWLLNITNDGWYGISAGPYQHLAAARLRGRAAAGPRGQYGHFRRGRSLRPGARPIAVGRARNPRFCPAESPAGVASLRPDRRLGIIFDVFGGRLWRCLVG